MSYCKYCRGREEDDLHKVYHDQEYGFPVKDDDQLFERLVLEINQAGLSWEIVLKKRKSFNEAYNSFVIDEVAAYSEDKIVELLGNSGIVRHRKKIEAAIFNANKIREIQADFGSFHDWLESQNLTSSEDWVKLFRRTFKFVGKEIVEEFLMSTGFLPGAHEKDCPVYGQILVQEPKWSRL